MSESVVFKKDPFETTGEFEDRIARTVNSSSNSSGQITFGKSRYDSKTQEWLAALEWNWFGARMTATFKMNRDLAALLKSRAGSYNFFVTLKRDSDENKWTLSLTGPTCKFRVDALSVTFAGERYLVNVTTDERHNIHATFADEKMLTTRLLDLLGPCHVDNPELGDQTFWEMQEFELPSEYSARVKATCCKAPAAKIKLIPERYNCDAGQWDVTIEWQSWLRQLLHNSSNIVFETAMTLLLNREDAKSALSEGDDKYIFVDLTDSKEIGLFDVSKARLNVGGKTQSLKDVTFLITERVYDERDTLTSHMMFLEPAKPSVGEVLNAAANEFLKWMNKK
jgi:hypothetical protein